MNLFDFQISCRRTAKDEPHNEKMSHALEGLISEVGDIAIAIKKCKRYGRALDVENIREKVGDVLYYLAMMCDSTDSSMDQCAIDNVNKLQKRYPEKFSEHHAAARLDKAVGYES